MNDSLEPRHTTGRIFGSEWTIANVAKLLRFNAGQGALRTSPIPNSMREINEDYLRKTSARHPSSGVAVTFRQDKSGSRHAELCFAGLEHYLPWSDILAEQWLSALFLQDRDHVSENTVAGSENVRHFSNQRLLPA